MSSLAAGLILVWLALQGAAYVCPMHADVTSGLPIQCPRCGMRLVRRADPSAREYVMRLDAAPASDGAVQFDFAFTNADGAEPARFETVHERELHIFIVSSDLSSFSHVHPVPAGGGRYTLRQPSITGGNYVVFADFKPEDAPPQFLQQAVSVPGPVNGTADSIPWGPQTEVQVADGMRISLVTEELRAGTPALLTFRFEDALSGRPVDDLQLYLGVPGHLFLTDPEFEAASHSHPLEYATGPQVRYLVRFTRPSLFRLWLEVQRRDQITTTVWTLNVPDR